MVQVRDTRDTTSGCSLKVEPTESAGKLDVKSEKRGTEDNF